MEIEQTKLKLQRNCLIFIVLILITSNLILVITLKQQEVIVRLVPTIDRELIVGSNYVSDEYLLLRADQILSLVFSINRENVQNIKTKLLSQVDNSSYAQFKEDIDRLSDDIILRDYRYSFQNQTSANILSDGMTVQISGYVSTYVGYKEVETNKKIYEMKFVNNGGIVNLISFNEVKEIVQSDTSVSRVETSAENDQ